MPGDIPHGDPGMPSRSRYPSEASQSYFNVALVPGDTNVLTPQRVEAQSIGDAMHVEGLPDTSLQASHNNNSLFGHRWSLGPFPSNSPNPSVSVGSTIPQNLHVGADVFHTHHATSLGEHVGSVAFQSYPIAQQPGQAAVPLRAEPVQVAAFERDAALAAILPDQERAIATPDERGGDVGIIGFNTSQFPQQASLGNRLSFQQETQSERLVTRGEVDQGFETTVRPPQNRPILGNQHAAFREFMVTQMDSRMFPNEHQLAATQQRHNAALVSPDSFNPSYQTLDNQNVFEDLDQVPSTFAQYPNLAANNMLSPTCLQHTSDSMYAVAFPTDVNVTRRETPTVSDGFSILGNQQLADMGIGINVRDSRIALNEHQLAATQQQRSVALGPPDSVNSPFQTLGRQHVFEDPSAVPSTAVQNPNSAKPMLSPINPQLSDALQMVAASTVAVATGRANPEVSGRDFGIAEKDSRMLPNEHQLAATQQRHNVALVSPDSIAGHPAQSGGSQFNSQDTSGTLQMVAVPTVVGSTGGFNPRVPDGGSPARSRENHSQSSNVAAQHAVASMPQSLHQSGISPAPVVTNHQLAELVTVSSLPITLNVMVPSAIAVGGSNTTESVLVQQLQAEVSRLSSALQLQQQQLQQMQQQIQSRASPQLQEVASVRPSLPANLPTASNAVVPCAHAEGGSNPIVAKAHQTIAPACAPPASLAEGAAPGAPLGVGLSHASLAGTPCGSSTCRATGSESYPQQVLPPVVPPLPLHLVQRGAQHSRPSYSHHKSSCRSSDSSSSELSSDSSSLAPVDFARQEENTVMVKSLTDLVFPRPPVSVGEARGYMNQVLTAIGKLQKTPGNELYLWAQECLTSTEEQLQADPRYPRTDREVASKLLGTCKDGRFGLLFNQMLESERAASRAMPCGRAMLRRIFKHFQLERDRLAELGERNLLSLKVPGNTVADLVTFRDTYIYVMSAIPVEDMPRPQTLFNHLIDELEHHDVMAPKVVKAREARLDSHRRTTDWLWSKVELAIQLEQQERNRRDFDEQLGLKPAAGYSGTNPPSDDNIAGAPAPTPDPDSENTPESPASQGSGGSEDFLPWRDTQNKEDMQAAPTQKASPVGLEQPSSTNKDGTYSRGRKAKGKVKSTTEKAITPCMFFAYNICNAEPCAFLHSKTNKYRGPPPRSLRKGGNAPPNAYANVATVIVPEIAVSDASKPVINAMPFEASTAIPWLWDTAAGRHLIGRQALTPSMQKSVQHTPNPIAFATGGGSQSGKESLNFSGSRILDGEEVYVLEECPPAQSIGKAVIDKGYMFIWDPRESVPYLVAPENVSRCRLKVPKNAKICASRVVEYVPQYDEELTPCSFEPRERLAPIPNAMPASSLGPKTLVELDDPNNLGNSSIPTYGVFPPTKDVKTDLAPDSVDDVVGLANTSGSKMVVVNVSNVPNNPMDDQLLVELGSGEPPKDKILKQQATNPKHMRLNSSDSQFYPISHITKDNAMKFSHSHDGLADGRDDSSEQQHEQLSSSSVVLNNGFQKFEVITGKVESHRGESVAANVHNSVRKVHEGDLVFPVGMSCSHALFRGGNPGDPHDLKFHNNAEDDVLCHKDGGNNDPSAPDLRRCPVNTFLDHVLITEDTPGCATCNTHNRHPADQCCAHFTNINTVEEKKRHQKGRETPLNAST